MEMSTDVGSPGLAAHACVSTRAGGSAASGSAGSLVAGVLSACSARFGLGGDAELEWGCLDGRGLRAAAVEVQRAVSALQHQQRSILGLIDERRAFTAEGSRDAADWAAGRLGLSRQQACEQLSLGRRLQGLPALAERAANGELSAEQAKPATLLAEAGEGGGDAGMAVNAPSMGVAALQRRAAKARRPGAADHVAARNARIFESWTAGHELRFRGSVPIDGGAGLLKAIERSMPDRDPNHPATLGQRQADGLLALASVRVAGDADPDRATVVVIAELAAVCDDDPAATAELETGQPLATETARRLVCDSRLSVLVQDRAGRAVGVSTTQRTVTPALRRALSVRDGHCRFGDCTARRFLHGHHIDHWPAATAMSNLALICYQHHHSLHEGGWHLTGDPFGELVAVHPDGRRSPPNHPQDHDPPDNAAPPGRPSVEGRGGDGRPDDADQSPAAARQLAPVHSLKGGDSADEPPDRDRAHPVTLFHDSG